MRIRLLAALLWELCSCTPEPETKIPVADDPNHSTFKVVGAPPIGSAQSAQARRIGALIESLERSYTQENRRWTPALRTQTLALLQSRHKSIDSALDQVLDSPHRVPGHPQRDRYRHPKETLLFFGLTQDVRLVEMFPGGGWYTEILAPLLASRGKLVVPAYDPDGPRDRGETYFGRMLQLMLAKSPELFGSVETVPQTDGDTMKLGPESSADIVLAIREMHNWVRDDHFDGYLDAAYQVLKPGGTLGVVQHRAEPGTDPISSASRGYLPEAWVIEQVESVGFKLVDNLEINANPNDTKDYPGGVWALPPTLSLGAENKAQYLAIGESDRMTLRFVKPL